MQRIAAAREVPGRGRLHLGKASTRRRMRASIYHFFLPMKCARMQPAFRIACIRSQRSAWPVRQEAALDSAPRSQNGFLSSLTVDDFELIRPHLRTADLNQDMVLVEVDETLKRAYLPHKGVISLVVKLARGEHVQIAMIGRDSIFGAFSALGDSVALNGAVVLVPGVASSLEDRKSTRLNSSHTVISYAVFCLK